MWVGAGVGRGGIRKKKYIYIKKIIKKKLAVVWGGTLLYAAAINVPGGLVNPKECS